MLRLAVLLALLPTIALADIEGLARVIEGEGVEKVRLLAAPARH